MIGAPPGYVGYDEGGQLTEAVRRRPYSVILLDEIEKAHPEVYNVLLQVLDEGRLTDGKGRVINFTNSIIIATSNVGAQFARSERIGFSTHDQVDESHNEQLREHMLEAVRGHFRPEFINRLDEMIVFHALREQDIEQIVRLQVERVVRQAATQGIVLQVSAEAITWLAQHGYSADYGARELKRTVQTQIENALAKQVLSGEAPRGSKVEVLIEGGKLLLKPRVLQEV
jgi:ATP-dependent Clp protease ATP-binding subunit ClpC